MVITSIEQEPDPEPDIRRLSSFTQHNQPQQLDREPIEFQEKYITDIHHGHPDARIDSTLPLSHHGPGEVDEEQSSGTSGESTRVTFNPNPDSGLDPSATEGEEVYMSKPPSNRPKIRDFARPIRRATGQLERIVPAKRQPPEGPPQKRQVVLHEPTWGESFKNTIKGQPLLCGVPVILPIAWALHFTHQSPVAVFICSLIGIVPLAGGLGFATEELAHRVGEAWGGLLNASFGNAVELLIAILALVKGQIDIVQASMVGSILSNVLLVLGMSYFAGGLRFHEQLYGVVGAQMHISLLGITLTAIVLPAAYHYAYPSTAELVSQTIRPGGVVPEGEELNNLLKMSRGLSFILLTVYAMFLTFQLWTHAYLFRIPREPAVHPLPGPQPTHGSVFPRPNWVPSIADSSSSSSSSSASSTHSDHTHSRFRRLRRWSKPTRSRSNSEPMPDSPPPPGGARLHDEEAVIDSPDDLENRMAEQLEREKLEEEDGVYIPPIKVKFWFAIGMLCAMTALAGVSAEFLVDSIDGLTETGHVSREFVGLILLPVIGNSVEHITAVTVSVKDKLNLSMSIAVGSSIQVSLCLLPILVLIGWGIGQPMMLFFDTFETITLVISVLLVNFAISDGRTNYLEGFVMMMAYFSIALVCWFYDPVV